MADTWDVPTPVFGGALGLGDPRNEAARLTTWVPQSVSFVGPPVAAQKTPFTLGSFGTSNVSGGGNSVASFLSAFISKGTDFNLGVDPTTMSSANALGYSTGIPIGTVGGYSAVKTNPNDPRNESAWVNGGVPTAPQVVPTRTDPNADALTAIRKLGDGILRAIGAQGDQADPTPVSYGPQPGPGIDGKTLLLLGLGAVGLYFVATKA